MRVGLVVPHIFMHRRLLPRVIFSPGTQAIQLAEGLRRHGADVILFTPGPVDTPAHNVTADLRPFEQELAARGDDYIGLLKKHPATFIALARQVQSELIARAFAMANRGDLDIVHIYTNEEDIALPFAQLCRRPVVFTHHDPFNFVAKYRSVFPKYPYLNWLSMSYAQRAGMPPETHWVGNIYHGLDERAFMPRLGPAAEPYIAFMGRIIEPKGLHIALQALSRHNQQAPAARRLTLKIAGKHYAGHHKDRYWQESIAPELERPDIEYVGFIRDTATKRDFLARATALVVPSVFEEPFGMVAIEALACGTPVVALDSGALPEIMNDERIGTIVPKVWTTQPHPKSGEPQRVVDVDATAIGLAGAFTRLDSFDRRACREVFESRFTLDRMCEQHLDVYRRLARLDIVEP